VPARYPVVAWYFRKLGIGPIVGTRTWGGLVGMTTATHDALRGEREAPLRRLLEDRRSAVLAEIDGQRQVANANGRDVRDIEAAARVSRAAGR
jgi:hypothetical protein